MQNIKNTDAFILMSFRDSVKHLKDKPVSEIQAAMLSIGAPFLEQLKSNGHDWADSLALMRAVWQDIERG